MKLDSEFNANLTDLQHLFGVQKEKLVQIVSLYADRILAEDLDELADLGGTKGLLDKLATDANKGIADTEEEKQNRITHFDSNQRNMGKRKSFWALC